MLPHLAYSEKKLEPDIIKACGPASTYIPRLMAAFVRRQGEYGMKWPGQIYDGAKLRETKFLVIKIDEKMIVK